MSGTQAENTDSDGTPESPARVLAAWLTEYLFLSLSPDGDLLV